MGEGAEGPAPGGKASDTAELRQIDALNRIDPRPDPSAPGDAASRADAREEADARADAREEDAPARDAPEEDRDRDDAADAAADVTADVTADVPPRDDAAGDRAEAMPPRRRDALMLETGHELAVAETLAGALRTVARMGSPGFPVDGLVVFGVTGKFLNVVGQRDYRRAMHEDVFRMTLTTRFPATDVVRTGRSVYLSSPREYAERYPATWPLAARHGRESWAFVPLVVAGRLTGVCLVAFAAPMAFTADERGLLGLIARLVAQALERTRTSSAELALSRGLRRSMGATAPASPGLTVATRYVPTGGGQVVGGDWYDVINLPNGRVALVIGDVEGHDVHAAGLMARLRTAVHAYAAEGHGPDAVLTRTSRFLTALDQDRYATCLYVEAEPDTGLLHMARAGHPHPVLRLPDGTCMIKHVRGGLPLGLMPDDHDYPVTDLRLQPGEIMMLCTDGLIETGGHDMFSGWVRVRDAMAPGPAEDLEGMAERLIRAVHSPMEQYEQDDAPTAGRPAVPEELYGPRGRARAEAGAGWRRATRTTSRCCCCAGTARCGGSPCPSGGCC
ncbi:GAF domain-containing SpoIIE family protein phosphatase [Actinacidiphila sp. DG2A-62]|uniref:PP2C family protein-serine/threonine phosphatase n=1 Tax=Actinacidiphila sp. DG2A-62 TaxID=3108821 RepID=UPI002DBA661F|nr:GAF domain-containing SpoIIE family protein phosphatase [Actinacidiphila sp. DG2A-62]MEC3998247.1 GAF domain-containing SpoIIE family protein phosphatase [Actinacidiphila sp. DG2A-62]